MLKGPAPGGNPRKVRKSNASMVATIDDSGVFSVMSEAFVPPGVMTPISASGGNEEKMLDDEE
ncbi:hypothetical protein BWQ96_10851 [Gracilariopsis chorda]|uniref:Uncharacterized protein n=1 Tax=Gracilariopsis chorda TaxID=448386 RepID=A0A2V3IBH4_9FLOR|nr:hypothetical protein BWQ96_10851 [Gracilariopsis chorda]|eukprot:PXF39462.1 hypothetical protein BWQ96_10851 [Gracilariopsis chorda]